MDEDVARDLERSHPPHAAAIQVRRLASGSADSSRPHCFGAADRCAGVMVTASHGGLRVSSADRLHGVGE